MNVKRKYFPSLKYLFCVQVYDPQDDSWTPIAHMMVPRCEFGLVALNNCLFAFGGWVGEDIGGSIEVYDPGRFIYVHDQTVKIDVS